MSLSAHLTEVFIHKDIYHIPWTRLGNDKNPPVIFVHGTPFSSLVWLPFAKALSDDYSVFLFDLPGFGGSRERGGKEGQEEDEEVDVSLALHSEALTALYSHWGFAIDDDNNNQPHVIAHDIGGHAALRAHLLHGLKYASLLLMDIVALTPWGSPFYRAVQANPAAFDAVPLVMFEGMLRAYVQNAAYKTLTEAKMMEFVGPWVNRGEAGRRALIRQIRCADMRHTSDMVGLYDTVMSTRSKGGKKRLKILRGANDEWIPLRKGERLAELTGPAKFVSVPEAGHLVQVDQPEIVMYEISKWLREMTQEM